MEKSLKVFWLGGIVLAALGVVLVVIWGANLVKDSSREGRGDLPMMNISLKDVDFATLSKDKNIKYPGNEVKILERGKELRYNNVEIKGHGNSTWESAKKPLQLKFSQKVDLLRLGSAKKWLLITNLFDASNLRNDAALYFGKMLGMEYAVVGDFLELNIDDDYQGLYYIVPKIEISKNAVDLRDSMGILVELDNLHGEDKGCYYSANRMCLTVKDVVDKENEKAAMEDFLVDFDKLELAAEQKDYEAVTEVIDVESFAKYFLLSEFTVNPDAYTSSWYMYKNGLDDKIHAGPGWDYDFALGNRNWIWSSDGDYFSPQSNMAREVDAFGGVFVFDGEIIEKEPDWGISRVMIWLMKIPQFEDEVKRVFRENLSGRERELMGHIAKQCKRIYPAALRDNAKWGQGDFVMEVEYLFDWMKNRYEHFERTYGDGKPMAGEIL